VGDLELAHEDYMWSVVGRRRGTRYPGFSTEPLIAFQHLLADLQQYGSDFLSGSSEDVRRHVERAQALKRSVAKLP
jgi:hypothetical protein